MSLHLLNNPNWEPFVLQRINDILKNNRPLTPSTFSDQPYVVFDFDNTSSFFDIEDHLMMYLVHQFALKLSEEELYTLLTSGPYDMEQFLSDKEKTVTFEHLAKKATHYYAILKEEQESLDLTALRKTRAYQLFSTYLLAHYYRSVRQFSPRSGENWVTYWFAGYTVEEFATFAEEMLEWALELPIQKVTYSSQGLEEDPHSAISVTLEQGLRFPPEIHELYQALQDNHIATYVVTASPELLGQAAARYYQVPSSQVIGIRLQVDGDQRITSKLRSDAFVTKGAGKVEAIKHHIAPLHQGKMPLMVFGDSSGDYQMLSQIEGLQLGLLFNRGEKNCTQDLIKEAIRVYGQADAPILVQGRDENQTNLRPSQKSILLGTDEEILMM